MKKGQYPFYMRYLHFYDDVMGTSVLYLVLKLEVLLFFWMVEVKVSVIYCWR